MTTVNRQLQMFYDADRRIADTNNHFMELINHPTNPLTNRDLAALVRKFPERWGRYSGFIGKLKE